MYLSPKKLLRVLFFLIFSAALVDVVSSILIWNLSDSLFLVLVYMGSLFISMIPLSFFVGFIIDKWGGLFPFFISLVSMVILTVFFVFFPQFSLEYIWLMGILAGLYNISFYLTSKVVITQLISSRDQDLVNVAFYNYSTFSYLIAPLLLFFSRRVFGFQELSLLIALFSACIGLVLLFKLKGLGKMVNKVDYDVFNPFAKVRSERKGLFIFSLIYGLKNGIFWAVFSVITLMIVGSLGYWSVIAVMLKLTSIITNKFLENIDSIETFERLLLGFSVFYLGFIVLVLANVSVFTFLLFALVDSIVTSIIKVFYSKLCYEVTMSDADYQHKITEYGVFEEVGLSLGRVISLLLLGPVFIFSIHDQNLLVIVLTFAVISFVPLLFFKVIQLDSFKSY